MGVFKDQSRLQIQRPLWLSRQSKVGEKEMDLQKQQDPW